MTDFHPIRVVAPSRSSIEQVDARFQRDKILWARSKSWEAYDLIKKEIREGMTEKDAFRVCMDTLERFRVAKHWHKPFVRFGPGTKLTFHDPLDAIYRLKANDPVYIDIGPVWADEETGLEYEGDVGDTFVFGSNVEAEKIATSAREIFQITEDAWAKNQISGEEIYLLAKNEAESRGYKLIERVDGHRVSDFPHQKYSRERLSKLEFDPAPLLWVLEIHLEHRQLEMGAFFEDILGIQ